MDFSSEALNNLEHKILMGVGVTTLGSLAVRIVVGVILEDTFKIISDWRKQRMELRNKRNDTEGE